MCTIKRVLLYPTGGGGHRRRGHGRRLGHHHVLRRGSRGGRRFLGIQPCQDSFSSSVDGGVGRGLVYQPQPFCFFLIEHFLRSSNSIVRLELIKPLQRRLHVPGSKKRLEVLVVLEGRLLGNGGSRRVRPGLLVLLLLLLGFLLAVWKSKLYGAFVLNHRVVLHAIDTTPARWRQRGQHGRVEHPTHWLISTQALTEHARPARTSRAARVDPAYSRAYPHYPAHPTHPPRSQDTRRAAVPRSRELVLKIARGTPNKIENLAAARL